MSIPTVGVSAWAGPTLPDSTTTPAVTTTAASVLLAFVVTDGGRTSATTVADNKGNTFILQSEITYTSPAGTSFVSVWLAGGGTRGSGHTVTASAVAGYTTASFVELKLGAGETFQGELFTAITDTSTPYSVSGTTTIANQLVMSMFVSDTTGTLAVSAPGFTNIVPAAAVGFWEFFVASANKATPGSISADWSGTGIVAPTNPQFALLLSVYSLPFGSTESSAGTEAANRSLAFSALTSESSAGTDTPNRTLTTSRGSTDSTAGTEAVNRSVAASSGAADSSAGTDSENRSVAAPGNVAESSAGTDAADRTANAGTFSSAETSAGSDTPNRVVNLNGAASDSSAGSDSQTGSIAAPASAAETSASADTANRSVAVGSGVTESSGSTDNPNYLPPNTVSVQEFSGSFDTVDRSVAPPPMGLSQSGLRRWLIQVYTDDAARREATKAAKSATQEAAKQDSAGPTARFAPGPVYDAALEAAILKAQSVLESHQQSSRRVLKMIDSAVSRQKSMQVSRAMIADTAAITHKAFVAKGQLLQRKREQAGWDDDDLLLLAAVL